MTVADTYKANAGRLLRSPDDPQALVDAFACLSNNGRGENGLHYLALAQRAYNIAPDEVNVMFNYASALGRVGRHDEAIPLYQRCIDAGDANWQVLSFYHIGIALRALGQNEQAVKFYRVASEMDPDNAQPRQDIALAVLAQGRLRDGLMLFEARHELAAKRLQAGEPPTARYRLPEGVKHWRGESLHGQSITVYHEEGTGDFIQFARFIPRLRDRGVSRIILAGADMGILELMAGPSGADDIAPIEGPFYTDYVTGSMSAPWRIGAEYSAVTGEPYIQAAPARIPLRSKLNVGLVWRGSSAYARDQQRSMPLSALCSLFDMPGAAFYSLQKGEAKDEITQLGFDGFIADLDYALVDWRATARVISALDVVVTVDTAVAHLAGALGKPVIILVTDACDWRWDRDSEMTPWYQSARVIRQLRQDDWSPCVARARELLSTMLSGQSDG